MKLICPNCNRIMKTFEPTKAELEAGLFDEKEIQKDEAIHHKPCSSCKE